MSLKKKIVIGAVILVVLGSGYYFWFRTEPESIATEKVKRGNVIETVSVTGELLPVLYADLSFPLSGIVEAVLVTEGDRVEKGDTIASLDRAVLESQHSASRVALRIAEENEKLARRDWGGLQPEERAVKKLATEQARENVRTLGAQISNTLLRAPFDGRISRLTIRTGEAIGIGVVVARLVGSDDVIIEARVPESDIAKVALGMEATLDFDALSKDEKFVATVSKIDTAATVVQGVVSYVVEFNLKQVDPRLREGMTANIDIETGKRENVLTLPFRALSRDSGTTFVEVRRGSNSFEKVAVTTGLEGDDGTVEILSGLSGDEEVTIGARQAK